MTAAARRILLLLSQGHRLVRGPTGWRVTLGAGFERVAVEVAQEVLSHHWAERVSDTSPVYAITDAGRAALAENP
jgi:hypothetical protein